MPNINERPVCHRAEDLVTYLYGEASEADGKDFAAHLQQCDACRSEFGVFQQVHDSILGWRNEALGSAFVPAAVSFEARVDSTHLVQHEQKLSALAALREFFSVSPLWLRAATGFAALLLCVLVVLTISRSLNQRYSQQQFDAKVKQQVEQQIARLRDTQVVPKTSNGSTPVKQNSAEIVAKERPQTTVAARQPKTIRPRGLSRQEREQLAKDLQLIPRDEDELPFALTEEPNQ
jgi:C4-dicarboxylate-specific signal transduction histidine kinase